MVPSAEYSNDQSTQKQDYRMGGWKDYKAWSDGAAHCVESTSQGWHRPGCTLLHSHVVQTLERWTRIQQLQQLLPLQLYRHPVSFFDLHDLCFCYINPSLASCFQWLNCLYILERFTAIARNLSWHMTAFHIMGDTNRFSHTKILPWHQLRLQPEPKKHAFNFNPACSWLGLCNQLLNTIQPCLPSSQPWYSPEKINHSTPAPKTQKTFQPWRKPREKNLSTMVDPKNFLRSMRRFRTSFLRVFVELWNLLLHQGDERADLLKFEVLKVQNLSKLKSIKKMFPHLCHLIISSHHAVMQSSEVLATITTFPDTTAGSWKHKDFPLPVAMYTQVSWLCMHVRVTWESSAYVYETHNILENLTANVFEKTFRWQSRTWFKMLRCSILFQHLNYQ